ncbi:sulfatase-like hydrolase/transferase [Opitutia bacterium ISCC 51]|nr:sulfatase-like hydrolase/transferase [Opitutae bacterium ISCC 51]QXD29613.1 sulfatase-like hydrolase/transferase [Opitutae bacterium ISCC 52]
MVLKKFASIICLLLLPLLAAAEKPHVVIFLADDLGWKDVGFHDSVIETPNLDRLASQGLELDRFYVQPICSPTRGALMSGKYPFTLGLQVDVIRPWDVYGLNLNEKTLPQYFKDAGYATAIVGKWHLGLSQQAFLPQNRGFDHQYGHYLGMIDYFTHDRLGGIDWHRNGAMLKEEGYTTDLMGDEAVRVIEQHDPDQPLFLYVPFNAPHTPLQAPDKYVKKYAHIEDESRRIFAGMVDAMDVAIGRVIKALESKEMRQNTLAMFTSDNGGRIRFGARNGKLRGGKKELFEGGIRVPTVIHWPDHLEGGKKINEVIHMVDILPTLAGIIDQDVSDIDGMDVLPILKGAKQSRKEVPLHIAPTRAALLDGKWKLVISAEEPVNGVSSMLIHLFDIEADPYEKTDLKDRHPEVLKKMVAKIEAYRAASYPPHGFAGNSETSVPEEFTMPKIWRPWLD